MSRRAGPAVLGALVLALVSAIANAQPAVPLIAALFHGTEASLSWRVDTLREELRALGYQEGRNYGLEVRWSDNHPDRLAALARELMDLKPAIAVAQPVIAVQALHRESKTVPIVMAGGAGAVRVGLIENLARPGGNVTGVQNQLDETTGKLFELLREVAPAARRVLVLSSGAGAAEEDVRAGSREAARMFGMTLIEAYVRSPEQLSELGDVCTRERCDGVVTLLDPNVTSFREPIIRFAMARNLPAVFPVRDFVVDGGLISYSVDQKWLSRRAATYIDRILRGAKPSDLPIEQPTRFELVVNLKAAKAIGLAVPQSVLLRADEVME